VPNAKDAKILESWLLIGDTGSGKTTLFLTIPGKKFAYLFDPRALATLGGYDIDYEEFYPEGDDLDPYPRSVRKDKSFLSDNPTGRMPEPTLYLRWLEDINKRFDSGFFNDYDAVMIDSGTLLARVGHYRVRWLQEKKKREDERTDYRLSGDMISDALWQFSTLPCHTVVTVHHEMRKDGTTAKVNNRMTLPGGARMVTPRLNSNIWVCTCENNKYMVQTRPSRENPTVRTSMKFRDMALHHDMTIPDLQNPEKYGIGGILSE